MIVPKIEHPTMLALPQEVALPIVPFVLIFSKHATTHTFVTHTDLGKRCYSVESLDVLTVQLVDAY